MKIYNLLFLFFFSLLVWFSPPSNSFSESFLECFNSSFSSSYSYSNQSKPISDVVFTNMSSSMSSLLQFSIRNLRFLNSTTPNSPKPLFLVTPFHESHVQATVVCAEKNHLQVRIRSGGHDYEGLSYKSLQTNTPFIVIDLLHLNSIDIDMKTETAWVESGATLGEFYYEIARKSRLHGFPAGSCPTVGVGGHISGGGFGTLFRKYGLAADNVIDAKIVDVNGRIMDRISMEEDLFWAIRGGGGASFGIVLSWRLNLVSVPSKVTTFIVEKTLEQGATVLFQKWQKIGNKLDEDLFLHVTTGVVDESGDDDKNGTNKKTIKLSFVSLFLGPIEKLIPLMNTHFPELGLQSNNCTEMTWIQSVLSFAGFSIESPHEVLLNRTLTQQSFFKAKSDYVTSPISLSGLKGLWENLVQEENSMMILTPYGGKMSKIYESETPFPHRKGIIYGIQYLVTWDGNNDQAAAANYKHLSWMKKLYSYMETYVSKLPRSAYLNYRDLDLGRNYDKNTSYEEAKVWGLKYFNLNFDRLVKVKTEVDPLNFFWNEQSIPSLYHK